MSSDHKTRNSLDFILTLKFLNPYKVRIRLTAQIRARQRAGFSGLRLGFRDPVKTRIWIFSYISGSEPVSGLNFKSGPGSGFKIKIISESKISGMGRPAHCRALVPIILRVGFRLRYKFEFIIQFSFWFRFRVRLMVKVRLSVSSGLGLSFGSEFSLGLSWE